ncbi:hypothetical protein PM082_005227 [Marasmius tenuissimus]|nr:hypothetical protein PM082_005227 [Marasmius tenuissimus]
MTSYSSYDSPPPSSPASSPSPYVDSSPPSSPGTTPLDLDSDSWSRDPYAASTKATKSPKIYEKKRARPVSPSPPPFENKKFRITDDADEGIDRVSVNSLRPESEIWDDAVANAIDTCHGLLNLENHNLSTIPSQAVVELDMLYVPTANQEAELEHSYSRSDSFNRTKSTLAESSGIPREEVQLMLGHNTLTYLPQQLFAMRRLTVLSLRFNNLSVLPPEIGQLSSLKTLNVSSNKLLFLPSEILRLKLDQLQIFPNPFLPPPRDTFHRTRSFARSKSRPRLQEEPRPCSPTITIFNDGIVPLFELCLRKLCSPLPRPRTSLLEETYQLPLSGNTFPPLVRDVLNAIHYNSVHIDPTDTTPASSQGSSILPTASGPFSDFEDYLTERLASLVSYHSEYRHVTGRGTCPSPIHSDSPSIFVVPAEERFTWEHTVAGVSHLGHVPIRWRGCQRGCLDFLDEKSREPPANLPEREPQCAEQDIVTREGEDDLQPLQLTSGFEFDGFGD